MSNQHIQATLPGMAPALRPLGSLRTVVGDRLARVGRAIWHALEDVGRQRSNREFLAMADRCQDVNPKLARELRAYVRGGSTY
jgi:hypothetical protein